MNHTSRQWLALIGLAASLLVAFALILGPPGPDAPAHPAPAVEANGRPVGGVHALRQSLPVPSHEPPAGCKLYAYEGDASHTKITRVWDICAGSDKPVLRPAQDN